jgi:hypothetical protein
MCVPLQNHVDLSEGLVIISQKTVVNLLVQMMVSKFIRELKIELKPKRWMLEYI